MIRLTLTLILLSSPAMAQTPVTTSIDIVTTSTDECQLMCEIYTDPETGEQTKVCHC